MLEKFTAELTGIPRYELFMVGFFVIIVIFPLIKLFIRYRHRKKTEDTIGALASNMASLTPEDFFELRGRKCHGKGAPMAGKAYDFPGVYILYNQSKKMHYVGQSLRVFDRVNNHFTGKGNGDVYADYKYGDLFDIRMIAIDGSGYTYLNDLERDTIMTYKAFSKGYNKTRGNL